MIPPYSRSLRQPLQIKVGTLTSINNTLKKIIGVALVLFILFIACLFPIAPIRAFKQDSENPILTFPPYLEKTMYPGTMSGTEGRLCYLPNTMPTFEECDQISKQNEENVKKEFPNEYQMFMTDQELINRRGGSVTKPYILSGSIQKTNYGMDKRKVTAYSQALFYVQKDVLNSADLFTPQKIVSAIRKTNLFVTKYLNKEPGELRMRNLVFFHAKTDDLQSLYYQEGGTNKDLPIFKTMQTKLHNGYIDHLDPDELRVLKQIGHVPCPPEQISHKLEALAKKLILKLKGDPIKAAVFIHRELQNIQPFKYGTGRVARIWMNMVLQLGGYKGVVFPNSEDYAAEVIQERKTPGTFTAYLKRVIEWNRLQPTLK